MDSFDPAIQLTTSSGLKPLVTFAIFAALGSFFLGALLTAVREGVKEQGWFNLKKNNKGD